MDDSDRAHNRVSAELARLGADAASAPEVPAEVTARVGAALRAAGPAHTIPRPRLRRRQQICSALGIATVLAGAAVGATMLNDEPEPSWSPGPTAKQMTAPKPATALSEAQILGLLSAAPDYGLLEPNRRASCLRGLGYSVDQVLGAGPVDVNGTRGVLILLPDDAAEGVVVALAVKPDCNADHTALLAETTVTRP